MHVKQEDDVRPAAATAAYPHRPIITWSWLHRITHARYYGYVTLPILLTLYILSLTHIISTPFALSFCLVVLVFLCTCELTRYDRHTCYVLLTQFETLFVCAGISSYIR